MFRPITRRWGICFRSYPKIHRLDADAQVHSGFADPEGKFFGRHYSEDASLRGVVLGEVLCELSGSLHDCARP